MGPRPAHHAQPQHVGSLPLSRVCHSQGARHIGRSAIHETPSGGSLAAPYRERPDKRRSGGRSDASDAQRQCATEAAGHESSLNKGPWGIGLWKPACTVVGGRMY